MMPGNVGIPGCVGRLGLCCPLTKMVYAGLAVALLLLRVSVADVPSSIDQCYLQPQLRDASRLLPRSLDHFLYLVDKMQRNPSIETLDAPSMATVILKRFQVNGVSDFFHGDGSLAGVYVDSAERVKQEIVHSFLPNVSTVYEEGLLSPEEQCLMHLMVSAKLNATRSWWQHRAWGQEPQYVREDGCVLVDETRAGTVSLGPVLAGIAAAGSGHRQIRIGDLLLAEERDRIPEQSRATLAALVDNMYATTLAAELGQASILHGYPSNARVLVGPDGVWDDVHCPREYNFPLNGSSSATTAELYGAIDGLVLGNKQAELSLVEMPRLGLSRLLRMYYGRGVEGDTVHGCDRGVQLGKLSAPMLEQTRYFAYVYLAKGIFNFPFVAVSQASVDVINAFNFKYQNFPCTELQFNLKCEVENDVFLVMDVHPTAGHDEFRDQRQFFLTLINTVTRRFNNTHFAVLTNGARFKDLLKFDRGAPNSLQRCDIANRVIDPSRPNMASTVNHVQVVIRALKSEQRMNRMSGTPGKVVLFVYQQSTYSARHEVIDAIRNFKEEHPDVTLLAVGKHAEALKVLVTDEKHDSFVKRGADLSFHIPRIIRRLCFAGTVVEYPECSRGDPPLPGSVTEYVYPDTNRWFVMPSLYMNISTHFKVLVKPDYGSLRVCSTRVPPESSDGRGHQECRDASASSVTGPVAVLGPWEPCAEWPLGNCPALYWNVQGRTKGAHERCLNSSCESYNQIQVTITHEGARCGSPFASPWPLLVAALQFVCGLSHL